MEDQERGYNDDLVMAAAIGCWVRDTAITCQRDVEYKKAFLNSISTTRTNLDTRALVNIKLLQKAMKITKNKKRIFLDI